MPAHGKLKSSAVVTAANIPIETFNRWMDRRVIGLSGEDTHGNGRGKPRRFSIRTIRKLAIAHRISLLGVPANIAVTLASKFTDEPQRGRPIGGPFETGRTVLIATPDGVGAIHNIQPDGDVDALLTTEAAIVVDIGKIVSNVNSRLTATQ